MNSRALSVLLTLLASCSSTPADPKREQAERDLAAAIERWTAEPGSEDACVWVGRRMGYVGRYEDAVAVFSRGLERHPDSAWLLRFRGHRYITLRRFDEAVRDLERARELAAGRPDEVEPDGQPNKAGVPIGTLRSNIDYHLGLAHYLRGDLPRAAEVYLSGLADARANDDRLVSHTYWTWLTLRRIGRDADAAALLEPIRPDLRILENEGYHALLLHFRGEKLRDEVLRGVEPGTTEYATRGYGTAMKLVFDGDVDAGLALLAPVVKDGPMAAFGCIAAEVALRDLERGEVR